MTDNTKAIVTGMVASKNGLTLFFATGQSEVYPADSWRTRDIILAIQPGLLDSGQAELDLNAFSIEKKLAEMTNGTVRIMGDNVVTPTTAVPKKAIIAHVERAAYENADGFKIFISDFGSVKHQHRVEDLLRFMEKGDLPLADDGAIIAYKVLNVRGDDLVDCHTGRVKQRVGSLVQMDESLVNDNRNTHCAQGLHICARGYLGSFGGQALVMVKISAKDVIAVPSDTASKVRASRYHIVARVPESLRAGVVGSNTLMTTEEGRAFLAKIIAGDHAAITEIVDVKERGENSVKVLERPIKSVKNKVRKVTTAAPSIDVKKIKADVRESKRAKAAGPVKKTGKLAPLASAAEPKAPKKASKRVVDMLAATKALRKASVPSVPAKKVSAGAKPEKPGKVVTAKPKAGIDRASEFAAKLPHLKPLYITKLVDAERLHLMGDSMRDIAKRVGLDRESMMNNLRKLGVLPAAA